MPVNIQIDHLNFDSEAMRAVSFFLSLVFMIITIYRKIYCDSDDRASAKMDYRDRSPGAADRRKHCQTEEAKEAKGDTWFIITISFFASQMVWSVCREVDVTDSGFLLSLVLGVGISLACRKDNIVSGKIGIGEILPVVILFICYLIPAPIFISLTLMMEFMVCAALLIRKFLSH